ncbi:ankyrin repeat domain-containing protein [Pseudarthrobacter sp. P1]|uniref:ankyrin repeat domain-containing protein n=1 Tax=Pseudarthrobacter sp. P1 TaxID=3418418 RepID=UPI003CEEEFD8
MGSFRHLARALSAAVAGLLLLAGCAPSDGPATGAGGTATVSATSSASGSQPVTTEPLQPPSSAPAATPTAPAPTPLTKEEQMALDTDLILAAKANDAARVRGLIEAGGNVNTKDAIQDSAFLYAGAEGYNEVLALTLAHGADVASTNRYGGTALIPASEHGHVETVRILIAAGVPVNHVNNLGWTAMQEAVLLNDGGPNQQQVVSLLLAAGADPGIRDPQGRTALENADRLGLTGIAAVIRGAGF